MDIAEGAAASDTTAWPIIVKIGTGINRTQGKEAITGGITMVVFAIPIPMIMTMITTEPPVTITVEIAFMTIITRDVIVTNQSMEHEDQ